MERQVSVFDSVLAINPAHVAVTLIYQGIKEGKWKVEVEAIRRACAEGNKPLATDLKKRLKYVLFCGIFGPTHKKADMLTYEPVCKLDYDNVPPEQIDGLCARAMELPFVESAYRSASGNGLKVVVITDGTKEQHPESYRQVVLFMDSYLGIRSDRACKDPSRGHFVSYDPVMTFRTVTQPFHVCIAEELLTPSHVPEATAFVRSYLTLYPAPKHERNTRLFRLACEACNRRLDRHAVVQAATEQMSAGDFDALEIARTVKSAYCHVSASPDKVDEPYCTHTALTAIGVPTHAEEEEENLEKVDGEELRRHTPTIPLSVYEQLPEFLDSVLKYCEGERERDILLLSTITILSSLFYNSIGYYADKSYRPALNLFIAAPPASNKGVIAWAFALAKHYIHEAVENNKELQKKYKKEMDAYEHAVKSSRRRKEGEVPVKPEPPVLYYPHVPTSVSRSMLLQHMSDNGSRGVLIYDLEADALVNALQQDYGAFVEVIRKAFHHENVNDSYKTNGGPKFVENSLLAMLLAGTPSQLKRMIPTTENGLYSRVLLYTFRQFSHWKNVSPGKDVGKIDRHFDQLSMRLFQALKFLSASHTSVFLTEEQWDRLNAFFSDLLANYGLADREDFDECIKRHGLMAFRICMVLTIITKASLRMDVKEMTCSDEHFQMALDIVTTCLQHSRLLITSIPSTDKDTVELQNPDKSKLILKALPKEFTTSQFLDIAMTYGVRDRQAYKIIKGLNGLFIKKLTKGMYVKLH